MNLVFGATGKVGREVVKQLVAGGHPTRIYVRDSERAVALFGAEGYEIAIGDFDNQLALTAALQGVHGVFILTTDEERFYSEHLPTIVDAAKAAGVGRAVLLSARSDIGSYVPFLRMHGLAERIVVNSGIPCTILRPTWFMQNFLSYAAGGEINFSAGKGSVGFIDTRDIAAVGVKALTEPGHQPKMYQLTGPEVIDHYAIAKILSEVTGKTFVYNDIDPEEHLKQLLSHGYSEALAKLNVANTEGFRRLQTGQQWPDLEEILGHNGHTFQEFVADHVNEFRAINP